jgi:hypothetical protein
LSAIHQRPPQPWSTASASQPAETIDDSIEKAAEPAPEPARAPEKKPADYDFGLLNRLFDGEGG